MRSFFSASKLGKKVMSGQFKSRLGWDKNSFREHGGHTGSTPRFTRREVYSCHPTRRRGHKRPQNAKHGGLPIGVAPDEENGGLLTLGYCMDLCVLLIRHPGSNADSCPAAEDFNCSPSSCS